MLPRTPQNRTAIEAEHVGPREVLVELHRADFAAHPLQDEVDGRDDLDLAGVGIEGVLAGQQRVLPDAAAAVHHQLAVAILIAGHVAGRGAGVEDHHADIADRDDGLRHGLDGREQAVEIPGALDDDLELAAAIAAGLEEFLRLLEVVVERVLVAQVDAGLRRDDLAGRQ